MDTFIKKVKDHLSKWETEYLCVACYAAGHYGVFGKVVKALAKYVN